jgi:hypothetical protein
MEAMMDVYLEDLAGFSAEDVEFVCRQLALRGSAFPPSAGEIFAECRKVVEGRQPRETQFDRKWREALQFVGRAEKPKEIEVADTAKLIKFRRMGE